MPLAGGSATAVTSVGTYQPLPYLLPAATLRADGDTPRADLYARLVTILAWWAFICAAVWML